MHRWTTVAVALGAMTAVAAAQSTTTTNPNTTVDQNTNPNPDAPTYTIQFTRPAKVGQRIRVQGDATQTHQITQVMEDAEDDVQSSQMNVIFDAEADVVRVDNYGRPTVVSYTVEKCAMTVDGTTTEIASPGTTIIARTGNATTIFEINGTRADAQTNAALEMVAGLATTDATMDQILQTGAPRTVGESWSIDAGPMLGQSSTGRTTINGTMTLTEVTPVQQVPCMIVHQDASVDGLAGDLARTPAGFDVDAARMNVDTVTVLPLDTSLPPVRQTVTVDVDAILSAAENVENQKITALYVDTSRTINKKMTLISDPGAVATGQSPDESP